MSLYNVIDIAGSGMSANRAQLNLVASNVANANTVAGSAEGVYKEKQLVVGKKEMNFNDVYANTLTKTSSGVQVNGVVESKAPALREHNPSHSLADENGYVYRPNINPMAQTADMLTASSSYRTNVEVANTAKQLLMKTLDLGR